jgi:hypothetical protein
MKTRTRTRTRTTPGSAQGTPRGGIDPRRAAALVALAVALTAGCATTGGTAGNAPVKPYPLDECLVSGNKLGSMGPVITLVHEGQEIKFCCRPCVKEFQADPEKFLALLRP